MKKLATIFTGAYITMISSASSLAAEEAVHDKVSDAVDIHGKQIAQPIDGVVFDHVEDPHASSGGLPQFDPEWFTSQIFWLAISFGVLYFIFSKKTLPDISSVIENRKNHIDSDLETAEKLTAEADSVHDAYQAHLNKAQSDASEAIKSVEDQSKTKAENALDGFREKSDHDLKEAEKRIESSKAAAMDDMNQICVDAAAQAVQKIIGLNLDKSEIQAVVKNMNGGGQSNKTKAA